MPGVPGTDALVAELGLLGELPAPVLADELDELSVPADDGLDGDAAFAVLPATLGVSALAGLDGDAAFAGLPGVFGLPGTLGLAELLADEELDRLAGLDGDPLDGLAGLEADVASLVGLDGLAGVD